MSFASDKYETAADAYEAGYRAADAAGSIALAACEAREAKWAALAKYMADGVCDCEEQIEGACAACFARALLSAPRDSAALRAMLERMAREAWKGGVEWEQRNAGREGNEALTQSEVDAMIAAHDARRQPATEGGER